MGAGEVQQEVQRDAWGGKVEFILTCLGYAVGLGNVWRFPYLCGRNGGAAFLIPYFIMMIFAGLPVFYLELAIGQYGSLTPALLYEMMCPILSGIGTATIIISSYTAFYYNMIIAWAIHYLINSFRSPLPWDNCSNRWNTRYCFDSKLNETCSLNGSIYFTGRCWDVSPTNRSLMNQINGLFNISKATPAKEYLERRVLGISDGIHNMGYPQTELVLCLAGAWFLVFACLIKGIKSVGKVVYFTSTFPYVLLTILLVRGATLTGAIDGIRFYLVPTMTKLTEGKVWGDAAVQIFFSLSLGGGGLTTLASYNQFHNNILQDTLIIVIGNCFTSIYAGFAIFSILGFIARKLHKPVSEIAAEGVGLAFAAYPDAISQLKVPQLWAVLFFFMLILLGLGSQLVFVDVIVTAVIDRWPRLRSPQFKLCMVGLICIAGFVIGLCLTCPGSPYLITLIDNYGSGKPLLITGLAEVIMIGWIYGIQRFIGDICLMLGIQYDGNYKRINNLAVNPFWWICWKFITPVLLIVVIIFNWATWTPTRYDKVRPPFPAWADAIGFLMTASSVIFIPLMALIMYCRTGKLQDKRKLLQPNDEWGAANKAKIINGGTGRSTPDSVNKVNPLDIMYNGSTSSFHSEKPLVANGWIGTDDEEIQRRYNNRHTAPVLGESARIPQNNLSPWHVGDIAPYPSSTTFPAYANEARGYGAGWPNGVSVAPGSPLAPYHPRSGHNQSRSTLPRNSVLMTIDNSSRARLVSDHPDPYDNRSINSERTGSGSNGSLNFRNTGFLPDMNMANPVPNQLYPGLYQDSPLIRLDSRSTLDSSLHNSRFNARNTETDV